jgi:hypothetical protein
MRSRDIDNTTVGLSSMTRMRAMGFPGAVLGELPSKTRKKLKLREI